MGARRVIADEPRILALFKVLGAEGLEVDAAAEGERGMEAALTCDAQVVILGLLPPGSSGLARETIYLSDREFKLMRCPIDARPRR